MQESVLKFLFLGTLLTPLAILAQQQSSPPTQQNAPTQPATQSQAPIVPVAPVSDGKTRVYVADSQSWQTSGGWGASGGNGGGANSGGARPQTAEIIKTFNERCPAITITNNKDKASFAVILDHEGGKGALARRNKVVVFNREGDAIFSDSTRSLGNSVKDACGAIQKDMASQKK